MKVRFQKWLAWLLTLLTALSMLPISALAETSNIYDAGQTKDAVLETAFQVVDLAIANNTTDRNPTVSTTAQATRRSGIPTGDVFEYRIGYTLNPSPEYKLKSGKLAAAYSKYENVSFTLTPPAGVTLYDGAGNAYARPDTYVITLGEVTRMGYDEFTVTARMNDNGTAPDGKSYGELGVSMTADVTVTDQNLGQSEARSFTGHINSDTSETTVSNSADSEWTVEKSGLTAMPDGNGSVVFTYRVKAGKAVGGSLTADPNDYNRTGILNFEAFELTDTLPTPVGISGNPVSPTASTLTPVKPGTSEALATSVTGGAGVTELKTSYYNTVQTTGNASEAGRTPFYTEYLVTAYYPQSEFKLPYEDPAPGTTFTLENNAGLAYTLVGTAPKTGSANASLQYRELTKPGKIQVREMLKLAAGGKDEVDYDAFYHSVFTGSANFAIYRAADWENGVPVAQAQPVATLTVTDTNRLEQTVSKALAPGEYVILQTARPDQTDVCDEIRPEGGTAVTGQSWIAVTVPEDGTAAVTFLNPVPGKGLLRFVKHDEAGKGLGGAVFTATNTADATKVYSVTTQADGSAYLLLPAGEYKLEETKAPAGGYVRDETPRTVNVEAGKTTDLTQDAFINHKNVASLTITKYAVMFAKQNRDSYADTEKKLIASVAGITPGAFTFTLERSTDANFPADKTTTTTHQVNSTSSVTVSNLPRTDDNGNYYWYRLSETACTDVNFTKDEYQYVWQFTDSANTVENCRFYNVLRGSLKFKKTQQSLGANGSENTAAGNGRKFRLYAMENGVLTEKISELTAGTDGVVQTSLLPAYDAAGGKIAYYIQEWAESGEGSTVVYPTAYDAGTLGIMWGPVTLNDWKKTTDLSSKPIVNKENKGQILIEKKQTGTNTPLAGAEFKVYIENADGTKEFFPDAGTRLITDTNGWVLVRDLPIGKTYTIEEVSAPEGYRLSAASKQTAVLQNPLQRVAVPFSNDAKPKLQVEKKLTDAAGKTVSLGNRTFTFELYRKQADGSMAPVHKDGKTVTLTVKSNATSATSAAVVLEDAGNNYYLREITLPGDVISPDVLHTGAGEVVDGHWYFGPFELKDNQTTTAQITNRLNRGKIIINKLDAKSGAKLAGAKYTISVPVAANDANTIAALNAKGFRISTTPGIYELTGVTTAGNGGAVTVDQLPVYALDGSSLVYSIVETQAPNGYHMPDDNSPRTAKLSAGNNYSQTLEYKNAPKVSVTVKKFLRKQWEITTGHPIDYPLGGAVLGLYLVNADGTLGSQHTTATTDAAGRVSFGNLDGTKTYAVVELSAPAGYGPPDGLSLPTTPQALYGQRLDTLGSYNYRILNLKDLSFTNNAYETPDSDALINVEPYAQFKLIKREAGNADKLLNHAKFQLYSCTLEEYKGYVDAGKSNAEIVGGLTPDSYVYETGTALNELGSFLTERQEYGRVYWFKEIEAPAGYSIIGDGIVGPLLPDSVETNGYVKNGITRLTVDNQKESGEGDGSIRYFQVEIDKVLKLVGGATKPLANATFELWLADANFKPQVALTRFTTGLDTHLTPYDPGRGISESFEFSALYADAGYNPYIERIDGPLGADHKPQYYNYKANFILREVSYPADSTPIQLEYPLTIETKAASADVTTTLDTTYTSEKGNPIQNLHTKQVPVRVRKMGYVVSGYGAPQSETDPNAVGLTPLQGVVIGLYSDENCTREVARAATDGHGYANFVVEPNTTYWYKEISTISGYDISGVKGTFISPTYGGKQESYPVIFDPAYRLVTLKKLDASGNPVAGVKLRITMADGSAVKDPNGNVLTGMTVETGNDGLAGPIALPHGVYSVAEVSVGGVNLSATEQRYFKLANEGQNRLPIAFDTNEAQKTVELVNPGRGSMVLTKADDAGTAMSGVSFTVAFKPFTTAAELAADAAVPPANDPGFGNPEGIEATWKTNENGLIEKTNLLPGWYRLTETIPEGYVGHGGSAAPVIVKVAGVHLGLTAPETAPVSITNQRRGYLIIQKVFEPADNAPTSIRFYLYKDENRTQSANPAYIELALASGRGSAQTELDPGDYWIVEEGSTAWYGKYAVNYPGRPGTEAWVNGAMRVTVESGHVKDAPVVLAVRNIPSTAKVSLLKTDDGQPAAVVPGVRFAVYYNDAEGVKRYYQQDGSWLASQNNLQWWETNANGLAAMTFRLPFDRLLSDETKTEYWITEIYAPPEYVVGSDFAVNVAPGGSVEFTEEEAIVNETGLSIRLVKYGRTREHYTAADTLAGAEFTLYRLKNGKVQEVVATGVTDASGVLEFPNLPKLADGEGYAVAETVTPDTHVKGSLALYLGGRLLTETVDASGVSAYPVTQRESVSLEAHNTPKGSLAILKYNFLKPTTEADIPNFAEFEVTLSGGTVQGTPQTAIVGQYLPGDPALLTGAEGNAAKGGSYYVGQSGSHQGTLFASSVLTGLVPGTYQVKETATPQGFYYTPASNPGDPWYPVRTVEVDDDGGVAVCYIANIPNPELPDLNIKKNVTAVNGQSGQGPLGSLQSGWQTITYRISNFASTADSTIQLNLKWLELKDVDINFQDGQGGAVQAEHYVQSVTVGRAYYVATQLSPTPATGKIYATLYGWTGDDEGSKVRLSTMDVSGGAKSFTFTGNYDGFSVDYGTDPSGIRTGLARGFTAEPVEVTVRMRQQNGEDVVAAAKVLNTAKVRMAYDIGTLESIATSWKEASADAVAVEESKRPSMRLEKKAIKLDDNGNELADGPDRDYVQPGGRVKYTITLQNVSTNGASMVDPVLVDRMPDLMDFDISSVLVSAPAGMTHQTPAKNGQHAYCTFDGELAPGQYLIMTITGTVRYATVSTPSGTVENNAYAVSAHLLSKNTLNPTGTSFVDENGVMPAHDVDGAIFGGAEASYKGLKATTTHTLVQTAKLQLYKLVSADLNGGLDTYYGPEQYATVSAGGEIRYKIVLVNGGETEVGNIRIIDKLPAVGDVKIGSSIKRNSDWRVSLVAVTGATHSASGNLPYTVYTTNASESGSNYTDAVEGNPGAVWTTGVSADAKGVMIAFGDTVSLKPGEQITVTLQCKAPTGADADAAYFLMAVNDTNSSVTMPGSSKPVSLNSAPVKVTLSPAQVALGNRVWVDVNGNGLQDADAGEEIDVPGTVSVEHSLTDANSINVTLRTFINSDSSFSTTAQRLGADGFYWFDKLSPAAINPYYSNSAAYDANGDIKNECLLGDARTSYQLAVSGIPAGYIPTVAYRGGSVPDYEGRDASRMTDSNFRKSTNGVYVSERFYLRADFGDDVSFDLGLLRYRDLVLTKKGTDGRLINGAEFKIYGPYENQELYGVSGGLALTDAKLVATLTTQNGVARFESTGASHYLNHYRSYVIVESDSSAPYYLSNGLIAAGGGIAGAASYPQMSGGGIAGDNYFILKARGDDENALTESVTVTNTYQAEGALMLSGDKVLRGGELAADEFEFVLDSTGTNADPDFRVKYPDGCAVKNESDGTFTFPSIEYDYADAGKTYVYTLSETNAGVAGVTYDRCVYTVTVAITDNGDGTLHVADTYKRSDGKPFAGLHFENASHGLLTLEKRVAGNAASADKAFRFTLTLSDRKGAPVSGTFVCTGSGAPLGGNLVFDAGGVADVSLKHGQSIEISGLPTGTRYTIIEDDYTADGYVTTSENAQGTIARTDTPSNAVFTNTRNAGALTISKALAGNDTDAARKFRFTIQLSRTDLIPVGGRDYECEGAYTTLTFDADGKAVVELMGGESVTLKDIVAGTAFTVTEDNYASEAYFPTPASGVVSGTVTTQVQTAAFTNTRNTVELTVRKTLAGNAASADKLFAITVQLTGANGVDVSGEYPYTATGGYTPASGKITVDRNGRAQVELKGGQSLTVTGIPVDTGYTVTEADYSAEGYQPAYLYSDASTVRKLGLDGATITVVNTRNTYGALIIDKTVDGNAADTNRTFDFELKLERGDALPVDGAYVCKLLDRSAIPVGETPYTLTVRGGAARLSLSHNQSLIIPGILTGTRYTVTEANYSAEGYVTAPSSRTQTGVIFSETESYTAPFVNTRNTGELTIVKRVGGNAADSEKAFNFTLTLSRGDSAPVDGSYACVLATGTATQSTTLSVRGGKATFTLKHNQSLTVAGILKDTRYVVEEDSYFLEGYQTQPGNGRRTGSVSSPTIPARAEFLNTRNAGSLTVTKALAGNAPDVGRSFAFHVMLSRTDGIPVSGSYACQIDGANAGTIAVDASGRCQFTLRGGQRMTILGILEGTAYTVSEDDYTADGYVTDSSGTAGTIVTAGGLAAFTNTRDTGSLTVRKEIAGNAAEADRAFTFTVRIRERNGNMLNGAFAVSGSRNGTLTFTNGLASFTLRGGETITIRDIPVGATYSLTEAEASTNGYVTTVTGGAGTIRAQTVATARFLNTRDVTQQFTRLTVVKTWEDRNNRDGIRPASVTVYLYADGNAIANGQLTAANGWGYAFENLPIYNPDGTRVNYSVVEAATAGYYTTYGYAGDGVSITNTHRPDRFIVLEEDMVPLGGNINMNEGDCFN